MHQLLTTLRNVTTIAAGLALAAGLPAQSQNLEFPAASPAATVKQRVGVTDIEIVYSRPSMKGRTIFGGLVPYDEVWRAGANAATRVSFSTPVTFGGKEIPEGSYSLFAIPGKGEWTVILNKTVQQWGAYKYDPSQDVARVSVKPEKLRNAVESFTISVDDIGPGTATLALTWEKTRAAVPLKIDVVGMLKPKIEAAMAGSGKKPYFPAAMFYYEYNGDLQQALEWMNKALADQKPSAPMLYRKGLVLEKMGDKKGAQAAAQEALAIAEKQEGPIREEYANLSQALIKRVK